MPCKILVVDDNPFIRMLIGEVLSEHGFEIVGEAQHGFEALEMYRKLKPDLVILDICMPKMDGITALKEIKTIDPAAKIIICSVMSQHALTVQALKAGALDIVSKPFHIERLVECVIKNINGGMRMGESKNTSQSSIYLI